jgi:hypothetical protein
MPVVTTPSTLTLDHYEQDHPASIAADGSTLQQQQQQQRSPSPSPSHTTSTATGPQIRHAGRAHIRGKIRRVWRPRYLELLDQGTVRYYELPATADITSGKNSDGDHVNMISKYTLAIYHARILDVTTLRDIHVGLPRGSFGFLFRGQRLMHTTMESTTQTPSNTNTNAATSPLSTSASPPSQTPPPALLVPSMSSLNVISSVSSCRQGKEEGAGVVKEQRDFLCAVSSLEEAQTWVVALQWAATQNQQQNQQQYQQQYQHARQLAIPTEPWWKPESGLDESIGNNNNNWQDVTETVSLTTASSINDLEFSTSAMEGTTTETATTSTTTHSRQPRRTVPAAASSSSLPKQQQQQVSIFRGTDNTTTTTKSTSTGKMIVTKVTQFRTVRLSSIHSWHKWEIAYEIQGLLVRNSNNNSSSSSRHVETWKMLRTADDFSALLKNLCKEIPALRLDQDAQLIPIQQLPRLSNRPAPTRAQLQASLSTVDSILRSLVMDAAMINATSMKVFLGLTGAQQQQQQQQQQTPSVLSLARWWCTHDAQAVWERRTRTLPAHVTVDQYVKQWLHSHGVQQQKQSSAKQSLLDMYAATFVQRPWLVLGGVGITITTVALVPFCAMWKQMMPTVSVRLDYLVGSWIGAAYMGHYCLMILPNSADNNNNNKGSRPLARTRKPQGPPRVPDQSKQLDKEATTIRRDGSHDSDVIVLDEGDDDVVSTTGSGDDGMESDGEEAGQDNNGDDPNDLLLSSPLPEYPSNDGFSCWSQPNANIFRVRGPTYLKDKIKIQSDACPLTCRGVDVWMTDNPQRHIARHPSVLGGKLGDEDTFMVNFLLPFGNFVAYFSIPPLNKFPKKLRNVWSKFLKGDQQYRDARLKLLPVVVDGPWIVKAAVGPGTAPALLGKVIPLQYFFRDPDRTRKGVYEVDVIITASTIAKGILSVVKGHTKSISIAFAFIIEAAEQEELPETVLCSFQVHSLHLEDCPLLPDCNLDEIE